MQINEFKLRAIAKPAQKVTSSPFVNIDNFELPYNACIHYLSDVPNQLGIRGSNPLIRNWVDGGSTGVFMYSDIPKPKHRARFKVVSKAAMNGYYQKQTLFSKVINIDRSITKERQLIVMDYSALNIGLVIPTGIYQFYHTFDNITSVMVDAIKDTSKSRVNIIQLRMPTVLPEKDIFNRADNVDFDTEDANYWVDYDQLWLRELWLLIQGKGRLVDALTPKKIDKGNVYGVNELYVSMQVSNTLVTIDLKKLYEDGQENETETKNAFYKLLDKIKNLLTPTDTEALEGVEEATDKEIKLANDDLVSLTQQAVNEGSMSASEQKRFIKIAEASKDLPAPNGEKLGTFSQTKEEDYSFDIDDNEAASDGIIVKPEEARSSIDAMHKSYVNKLLDKHIAATALAFNDSGYLLKDYSVREEVDIQGHRKILRLSYMPIKGKETTIELPIPVVKGNEFTVEGITYSMDTQRVDAPIRKTASNKVALTSYYGKAFFGRSELSKYDWSFWLLKNIFAISLDGTDRRISKLLRTKKNKPDIIVPRAYYAFSGQVESFKSNGIDFNFDFYNREEIFGKEALSREKKGFIPVGFRGKEIIYIDMDNILYTRGGGKITPIKSIREHIGITSKEPVDMIFAKVYGKEIPISFMLGSYIGISKLIKLFKAEVREFPANTRDRLPDDSWLELLFKDKRLYVKKDNPKALMVFSGFTAIGDQLRTYNVSDLDKQSNYTPLILDMGLSPMIAKEFDIMKRYFIDPMTKDVLGQMKEPQKWLPLLERVVELLVTDDAPDETHPGYQRLRGYERIPGILYSEMVAAIRKHEMAPNTGNRKLEIPSWTITKAMTEDTSTQLVQDINPIHTLKQQEALTLSGAGGRSARTLVLRSRIYHDKDVGIVSESTPDSAKVAIRTFATPNSKIKGTNGLMGEFDDKVDNQTSLLSTNALLMPASHHDD